MHDNDSNHHDEDHSASSLWKYTVFAASLPLFYMGNYYVGLCFVLIGLLYSIFDSSLVHKVSEQDQLRIKYNIYTADDVLKELIAESSYDASTSNSDSDSSKERKRSRDRFRIASLAALSALMKKYGKLKQRNRQSTHDITTTTTGTTTTTTSNTSAATANNIKDQNKTASVKEESRQLSLICQEAVYICLDTFGTDDDDVVAASFALLALVANKCDAVRERHLQQADVFGLDVLITSMSKALERGKTYQDKHKELASAELQRKACLMLGALSDGDCDMASQIVSEGGLQAILDAVSWYRFHNQVANWALWAIFVMCFESPPTTKAAVVQQNGVPVILETMQNCQQESVEVARHGMAIIFDLLREPQHQEAADNSGFDVWQVRNAALAAGLHSVVLNAIEEYLDDASCMDIIMMGRELLVGTGYQGPIPGV